jgi:hypothetical protein
VPRIGSKSTTSSGLRRELRDGALLPRRAAVARALQLDAEVAHVLGRVQGAVLLRVRHRHGIAQELGALDTPFATVAADDEQTFARADE